jgi:ketosteroid isomerase-like protein
MDPVELAREGYAAFNRRDIAWIVDHLAPEIVWEDAREVPGSAVRVGVEHVERYLQSLHREWDEIRFEPERIYEAGDDVLAWARVVARGRASGVVVDAPVAHLFEIRGDRCQRVRTFFDRDEADASARRHAGQDFGL